ncbi:MAG: arabinose-5-phosphate isomerase [Desulfobulbus propionicus]|nr:MAG: arabinose-5-phosphate isomerase [Desulfobulbus propionicus]
MQLDDNLSIVDHAKEVLTTEAQGILAVRNSLGQEFEKAISLLLHCPSRLVVTGIGKSGLVGQKIAATLNSTGTPSFFLHPVEAMHGDLGMVSPSDVVLALSYSGETKELNNLMMSLEDRCAHIIAMTGAPSSTLASFAAVTLDICIPREACPLGLAPTTSTTATLAMGDAIAVALLRKKQFRQEDFRKNHPGGSLGERLKIAVSEVMLTGDKVPVVGEEVTLTEAAIELNEKNIGAVIVLNKEGVLGGIVTDGDIRRLFTTRQATGQEMVKTVMTSDPITIAETSMAADALSLMQEREITVLAVVNEKGRLSGILHLHDLLGKGEFRFLI